jgi:hypothetical protein
MPTMAEQVLDVAESQIGTGEAPPGSNMGTRLQAYQGSTTLGGTGWPWCAAFVSWVWQEAGFDRDLVHRIALPCTAVMCSMARAEDLVYTPRPGPRSSGAGGTSSCSTRRSADRHGAASAGTPPTASAERREASRAPWSTPRPASSTSRSHAGPPSRPSSTWRIPRGPRCERRRSARLR